MSTLSRPRRIPLFTLALALALPTAASAQSLTSDYNLVLPPPDYDWGDLALSFDTYGYGQAVASGDFNGDGQDDLAVGAPRSRVASRSEAGKVTVFHGGTFGLTPVKELDGDGTSTAISYSWYGAALAVGDFNRDGYDDLAIGAPGATRYASWRKGWVAVHMGSPTGLQAAYRVTQSGLDSDEYGDEFGFALTVGDFNGDGVDDLAVGAPGESIGTAKSGAAYVYGGRTWTSSIYPWKMVTQAGLGANESGDRFGASLTAGQFNGTGADDLVVGAPQEALGSTRSGVAFAYTGGWYGLTPWHYFSQSGLNANESGDEFGFALATADVNDDGYDDVLVGAPGETFGSATQTGAVFVLRGGSSKISGGQMLYQYGTERYEAYDRFGTSVLGLDVDGDGRDDALIGAKGETAPGSSDRSGAAMFYQADAYGTLRPKQVIDQVGLGANDAGDDFGAAMATGDFDGDHMPDLAIGAPGEDDHGVSGRGAALTYKNRCNGADCDAYRAFSGWDRQTIHVDDPLAIDEAPVLRDLFAARDGFEYDVLLFADVGDFRTTTRTLLEGTIAVPDITEISSPITLWSEDRTASEMVYEAANGAQTKFVADGAGNVIGQFTASPDGSSLFTLDFDGDRVADVVEVIHPDHSGAILVHGEEATAFYDAWMRFENPFCNDYTNMHAPTEYPMGAPPASVAHLCPAGSDGVSGPMYGPQALEAFDGFTEALCEDYTSDGTLDLVGGDHDAVLTAYADVVTEVIENGTDGERDHGAVQAWRTVYAGPFIGIGAVWASSIQKIVDLVHVATPGSHEAEEDVEAAAESVCECPPDEGESDGSTSQPAPGELEDGIAKMCEYREANRDVWAKQFGVAFGGVPMACEDPRLRSGTRTAATTSGDVTVFCSGAESDYLGRPDLGDVIGGASGSSCSPTQQPDPITGECEDSAYGSIQAPGGELWYSYADVIGLDLCPETVCD
ncbi:MAG: hypothetical protein EP330_11135 [Deltaproteobacteria bacterium]|nr:MAG: hypothetical protein EP330_11135 [Deltaproteobacteria bacterium]